MSRDGHTRIRVRPVACTLLASDGPTYEAVLERTTDGCVGDEQNGCRIIVRGSSPLDALGTLVAHAQALCGVEIVLNDEPYQLP